MKLMHFVVILAHKCNNLGIQFLLIEHQILSKQLKYVMKELQTRSHQHFQFRVGNLDSNPHLDTLNNFGLNNQELQLTNHQIRLGHQ